MRRFLLLGLLLAAPLLAAPSFRPRNGHSVRVRLGDRREAGFGVRQAGGEWRVEVGRSDASTAHVADVTTPGMKWQVAVEDGALRLEDNRFLAGHTYRVELRRGEKTLASALVYLYPPKMAARKQIQFDDSEAAADGEMATLPKPTL